MIELSSAGLASEWEQLLMKKRSEAKEISLNSDNKGDLINRLLESIDKLQKELSKLKGECSSLL